MACRQTISPVRWTQRRARAPAGSPSTGRNGATAFAIGGPPGSGKTRLLAEASLDALAAGQIVLAGRAADPPTRPLQPIAEALEHLATAMPTLLLRANLDQSIAPLVALAPALAEPPLGFPRADNDESDTASYRVLRALCELIERLSQLGPVTFAIDDLHWASAATVRLLRGLLRDLRAPSAVPRRYPNESARCDT